MGEKTNIEWTDATWSPIRVRVRIDAAEIAKAKGYTSLVQIAEKMAGRIGQHCEKVSEECEHCYAETGNKRCLPNNGTGLPYDRRSRDLVEAIVDERALLQPLKWKQPKRIFAENQSDLFAEWVTDDMRDRVFAAMALSPHTFQVLTKRADRMAEYFKDLVYRQEQIGIDAEYISGFDRYISSAETEAITGCGDDFLPRWPLPLPNVWLGVTAGTQKAADERIPHLLRTPAAIRFVSCEPLLGPIKFANVPGFNKVGQAGRDLVNNFWCIAGGGTGHGARPSHPDWFRSLRDQCQAAGVPFLFKQWGDWQNGSDFAADAKIVLNDGRVLTTPDEVDPETRARWSDFAPTMMRRVGKKAAGRLLDGVDWNEFPKVSK